MIFWGLYLFIKQFFSYILMCFHFIEHFNLTHSILFFLHNIYTTRLIRPYKMYWITLPITPTLIRVYLNFSRCDSVCVFARLSATYRLDCRLANSHSQLNSGVHRNRTKRVCFPFRGTIILKFSFLNTVKFESSARPIQNDAIIRLFPSSIIEFSDRTESRCVPTSIIGGGGRLFCSMARLIRVYNYALAHILCMQIVAKIARIKCKCQSNLYNYSFHIQSYVMWWYVWSEIAANFAGMIV